MDDKLIKKYVKLLKDNTARPVTNAILYYLEHKEDVGEKKYNFIVKITQKFLTIKKYESKRNATKSEYIDYAILPQEIADKIVEAYKKDTAPVKESDIQTLLAEMNEIF